MRMCARVCVFGIAYKLLHCFEYTRKWQRNQPIVVDRWIFSRAMIVLFFLSQFGKSQTLKPDCRTIRMFVSESVWVGVCECVVFSLSLSQWPTNQISFFWSQRKLFFSVFFSFACHCSIEIAISVIHVVCGCERVCEPFTRDCVCTFVFILEFRSFTVFCFCFGFCFCCCCFCFHFFIFISLFFFKLVGRVCAFVSFAQIYYYKHFIASLGFILTNIFLLCKYLQRMMMPRTNRISACFWTSDSDSDRVSVPFFHIFSFCCTRHALLALQLNEHQTEVLVIRCKWLALITIHSNVKIHQRWF